MAKILEDFRQRILKRNRVLQIGFVLFGLIIGIVLIGLLLIPFCGGWGEGTSQWFTMLMYSMIASLTIPPLLALSLFFIFLGLLLRTKRRLFQIILIFLIFLLVVGSFLNGLSILSYKSLSYLGKSLKFFPKSEKICEMIILSGQKEECYREFAKEKRDFRICDNNKWDNRLDDLCYSRVAEITKDETICQGLPYSDERDFCYLLVARAKRDPNLCQKIEREYDQQQCYKEILSK